jgi:transcriptional regulator of arginine metabolism
VNIYSSIVTIQSESFTKSERQKLIASTVMRKRIGTQLELVDALAAAGCAVTQATISRDIRDLGLEKVHDPLGRPRYVAPEGRKRTDPDDALRAVLSQFGRQAAVAQNIVVLQSELGSAPAIARALDRLEHPRIVGTLAGDDTCLVIARDESDAQALAREFEQAIE